MRVCRQEGPFNKKSNTMITLNYLKVQVLRASFPITAFILISGIAWYFGWRMPISTAQDVVLFVVTFIVVKIVSRFFLQRLSIRKIK